MPIRLLAIRTFQGFVVAFVILAAIKVIPTNDARGALLWKDIKQARLSELNHDASMFLFAGGSATFFGLNAARFQEVTGRPAFNLGVHASLGQEALLDWTLECSRPGDVVVWTPELQGIGGDFPDLAFYARPRSLSFDYLWGLFEHWFKTPPEIMKRWPRASATDSAYHPDAVGPFGDQSRNVGQLTERLCVIQEALTPDWPLIDGILGRAAAEGVTLVVRLPPLPELECNAWLHPFIAELGEGLRQRGVRRYRQAEMWRPTDEFHDTPYHLNKRGVERATQALINRLKSEGLL